MEEKADFESLYDSHTGENHMVGTSVHVLCSDINSLPMYFVF